MQDLLTVALSHASELPPEAFESARVLELWHAKFDPPASARTLARTLARPNILPSNLTPVARQRILDHYGPTYGTAILAGTQNDPDIIAAAAEASQASIRYALATNPYLPVSLADSLYDELFEFGTPGVIFRPGWEDFLATSAGARLAAEVLRTHSSSHNALLAKSFCEAYPQVHSAWLSARVLHVWPATADMARLSFALEDPRLTLDLIAQASFPADAAADILDEYLAHPDSPPAITLYLEHLPHLRVSQFQPAYAALAEILLDRLSDAEIDSLLSAEHRSNSATLRAVFPRSDDHLALAHTLIDSALSPQVAAELLFERSDWFEVLSACFDVTGLADPLALSRPFAPLLKRAINILCEEISAADDPAASPATARLLNLMENTATSALGLYARIYADSAALDPVTVSAALPPEFLAANLSHAALTGLIANKAWRRLFSRHFDHFEDQFDILEVAKFLDLSSRADLEWLVDSGRAAQVLASVATAPPAPGVNYSASTRPAALFWSGLSALGELVSSSLKGNSLTAPDPETRASLVALLRALIDAAPDSFWIELLYVQRTRSNFAKIPLESLSLSADTLLRVLTLIASHDTDLDKTAVVTGRYLIATPLNRVYCAAAGLEPFDAARHTLNLGLEPSPNSLGSDLYARLSVAVAQALGPNPAHWDAFMHLAPSWPADLDSLLDIATDLTDNPAA